MSTIASQSFKGIAVFTPGGDLVYCKDTRKQAHWHLHLCAALQEYLGLMESPHFLVPCFTATVDCWIDPSTQVHHIAAEAYPLVYRYQGLLNTLFGLGPLEWRRILPAPEHRHLAALETYRSQFPQLWESHDLIVDLSPVAEPEVEAASMTPLSPAKGPILRLFVSGHSRMTEQVLKTLQEVLESSRHRPYTLQMIDVSKHPDQAEADQISATPTLMRVWPPPVRRLVGELDNPKAILGFLNEL